MNTGLSIATRYQQLTQRERLLLIGAGAVASLVLPLFAHGWAENQRTALLTAQLDLSARMRPQRAQKDAHTQARVTRAFDEISAWSWAASSNAVGRILIEERLTALAAQSGIAGAEVKTLEAVEQIGRTPFVRAEVTGTFDWGSLGRFIGRLPTLDGAVVVESVSVELEGTAKKLKLVLLVPVSSTGRATLR